MLTGVKVDMILKMEHAHWLLADQALGLLLLGRDSHQLGHRVQLHKDAVLAPAPRVGKNPVFLYKKKQPSGFFGFFRVFSVLSGFYIYIFARKREFLGYFQFQEYF